MVQDLQISVAGRQLAMAFHPFDGRTEVGLAKLSGGPQSRAEWLIAMLATEIRTGDQPLPLEALTLAEFDAALAHLYQALYGTRVPCEGSCTSCGERYEFNLDLEAMQAALATEAEGDEIEEGVATNSETGRRFRLPTLGDLSRLESEGTEAWLRGLLLDGSFSLDLEGEIAKAAPVLSQDITANCPDCGAQNRVRFDLARYLLETLAGEAGFLWREVHLIAERYGWSLQEILELSRDVRRQLAGLIVSDRTALRLAS